jgi:hypothetical protein
MRSNNRWDGKKTPHEELVKRFYADVEFALRVNDVVELMHEFIAEGVPLNDVQDIVNMAQPQFLLEDVIYSRHRTSCGHLPGHSPAYHRRDRPRCR